MTLKKLLLFAVAFVLMLFSQSYAASVDTVKAAIVKYSVEMGVDPAITLSIARTESGFKHEARSAHGAVGVFQLLPSTARRMGLNPYSLEDNVKGGIMYYKSMYKMFGSMELAIAAYNAGPANVKKYKAVPPFRETKKFVSSIMSHYYYLKSHTDPAILAYNNKYAKKVPAKVTTNHNTQIAKRTDLPRVNITPHFVANSAHNAPVPIEKARSVGQYDLLDKPFEENLKVNSIEM